MLSLTGFCDMHWAISWILPFLLGLALGWWLWFRYKGKSEYLGDQIEGYKSTITDLEHALGDCKSKRVELEGDLALTKGKMREMENELKRVKKEAGIKIPSSASMDTPDGVLSLSDSGGSESSDSNSFIAYAKLKKDNLQIIEGIGPKMESILKENKVKSWKHLSQNSPEDLKEILNKYGDKYRIIDPSTWSNQAKLAHKGDWAGLIDFQSKLAGGKKNATTVNASKLEKVMVKLGLIKKYTVNDLKVVEGIGPKIAELLNDAKIITWNDLAEAKVEDLQEILDAAGSRFKLADPGTWPKQAELAASGQWEELEKYQDFLQGGK